MNEQISKQEERKKEAKRKYNQREKEIIKKKE